MPESIEAFTVADIVRNVRGAVTTAIIEGRVNHHIEDRCECAHVYGEASGLDLLTVLAALDGRLVRVTVETLGST